MTTAAPDHLEPLHRGGTVHRAQPAVVVDRRTVVLGVSVLAATVALPGCAEDDDRPATAETALGPASQVPVGEGKVFADQRVVVTQPTAGDFRAFSAVCTHQGCLVEDVVDRTIACPCHGSRFDITDGSVVRGPAQEPLSRVGVTVEGSTLTTT